MSGKIKILNVVSVFFSIPSFFGKQINHFHRKGYEIHIICSPSEKLFDYSEKNRFSYSEIEIIRNFSIIQDIISIIKIYKYIKINKIDIVSGHTVKGSLLSMIASFIAKVPKRVYFRHGFYFENLSGFKRFLLINIDRFTSLLSTCVVCVSPYVIEKSILWSLTKKKKLLLLNKGSCNGVDTRFQFNPSKLEPNKIIELRKSLGLDDKSFVIGYTGRVVKDKGIEELVDSYLLMKTFIDDISLLLVGPLENRNSISRRVSEIIKNENQIITTGLVFKEIEYYYSLMDLFVLPTYREGFGTSILEASSMGLPVLTTSHSGSKDAIINNHTGMYIKLTPKSILEKSSIYHSDNKLRLKHGVNGRRYMVENFKDETIWKEIENIYI